MLYSSKYRAKRTIKNSCRGLCDSRAEWAAWRMNYAVCPVCNERVVRTVHSLFTVLLSVTASNVFRFCPINQPSWSVCSVCLHHWLWCCSPSRQQWRAVHPGTALTVLPKMTVLPTKMNDHLCGFVRVHQQVISTRPLHRPIHQLPVLLFLYTIYTPHHHNHHKASAGGTNWSCM